METPLGHSHRASTNSGCGAWLGVEAPSIVVHAAFGARNRQNQGLWILLVEADSETKRV